MNFFSRNEPFLVVLNYHNFSKYNNYHIKRGNILETDYAENFEKQISFLKQHFHFYYPKEFFKKEPKKGLNVLCTFDDGYKDNFDIALPILKKHKAKAIFFVVTGVIGKQYWLMHDQLRYLSLQGKILQDEIEKVLLNMNKGIPIPEFYKHLIANSTFPEHRLMMNWYELKTIKNNGFKVESHTVDHEILSFLSHEDQRFQIKNSVLILDKELSQVSKSFSYPNGLYNNSSLKIIKETDLNYAFSTESGVNKQRQEKLLLKRIGVNASDSNGVIIFKIFLSLMK